jgi:thiol-disulfide isomerase/thioredoxin
MRAPLLSLVASFALTVVGAPLPLTMKEVSLMLRSGYTSESVLREITARRLMDSPDSAMRQSLVESGASAQLLAVLDKGDLVVDAATAASAREHSAAASQAREAQTEKIFRDATAVLVKQRAAATLPSTGGSVMSMFRGKLVVCRDGVISPADDSAVENKKLIGFYFSAHWCAPCRKYTPELIDYYNRVKAQHPEFEIIFVSADRSRFNWETYMGDARMPWPAIDFDQLGGFENLQRLGGGSIPSLLVSDATGRVVASSYQGENYVGPQNAIAGLEKIFAAGSNPPVAQSR